MRTIRATVFLDTKTFEPILQVHIKDECDFVTILSREVVEADSLFHTDKIGFYNNLLSKKKLQELTTDEIEWVKYRDDLTNKAIPEPSFDEFKKLSGI